MKKLYGKKKLINLFELITQAVFLVSLFAIQSVEMTYHSYSYNSTTNGVAKMSLFAYGITESNSFVIISASLMLANLVLCLVSLLGNKSDKDGKLHIAVPIINLFFGGWILSVNVAPSGYDTLSVNPAFKIFGFFCLIVVIILAVLKRSSFVVPKSEPQPHQVINNIQKTSDADELKKFKDLLDSDVISQEEFDAKKKELLGL